MATNKFFKSLLFVFNDCFFFCVQDLQHIQFCTTELFELRAANGKLVKLSFKSKAIEIEAPQSVLPNWFLK
jgi:hypothetical protein